MEGKDGLDRGFGQTADTRFLQGCRRIRRVVTHRNDIISRSQRENSVGDTRHQANHTMPAVGYRDGASRFIGYHAAGMRSSKARGYQQTKRQESRPHGVAASL